MFVVVATQHIRPLTYTSLGLNPLEHVLFEALLEILYPMGQRADILHVGKYKLYLGLCLGVDVHDRVDHPALPLHSFNLFSFWTICNVCCCHATQHIRSTSYVLSGQACSPRGFARNFVPNGSVPTFYM